MLGIEQFDTCLIWDEKEKHYVWESKRYPMDDDGNTSEKHNTVRYVVKDRKIVSKEIEVNVAEFEQSLEETKKLIEIGLTSDESLLRATEISDLVRDGKFIFEVEEYDEFDFNSCKYCSFTLKKEQYEILFEIFYEKGNVDVTHDAIAFDKEIALKIKEMIYNIPEFRLKLLPYKYYPTQESYLKKK